RDLELFLSDCDRLYPDLHSFPTRRSSDLYFALRGSIYSHIVVSVRAAYQTRRITLSLLMLLSRLRRVHDRTHDSPTIGSVCLLRSEEHTSELQSRENLVCRLLLEKKKIYK